eukprot:364708-Chlamydomonas_euryale.AAC.4
MKPDAASSAAANGTAVAAHISLSSAAPSRGASITRHPSRSTRRPSRRALTATQPPSTRQNCSSSPFWRSATGVVSWRASTAARASSKV